MFTTFTLLLALLQVSLAAAGNAIISNRCPYDIWVWSVDETHWSAPIHVASRSQYSEPLRNCNGCGTSLKVSKSDKLVNGAHTQFEYSIVNNQLWYDISFVDCAKGESADSCPGHALGLAMGSAEKVCGTAKCEAGSYCPTQAYYVDTPVQKLGVAEPVFTCPGAGTDLDLVTTMCSGESSLKRSVAGRVLIDAD